MAFISNGTTILDAGAFSVSLGGLVLLSEATASSSSSIEFTSGIDSTYDIYQFEFINMHPSTDSDFQFNFSTDSGSNYNVTKTSTWFNAYHNEAGTDTNLGYRSAEDLAQSTGFQNLTESLDSDNDQHYSGTLTLFNPSSTTYVKHWISVGVEPFSVSNYVNNNYNAGYGNTTSAINAIKFQMSSGNIDAGTIKMYGIKGS